MILIFNKNLYSKEFRFIISHEVTKGNNKGYHKNIPKLEMKIPIAHKLLCH